MSYIESVFVLDNAYILANCREHLLKVNMATGSRQQLPVDQPLTAISRNLSTGFAASRNGGVAEFDLISLRKTAELSFADLVVSSTFLGENDSLLFLGRLKDGTTAEMFGRIDLRDRRVLSIHEIPSAEYFGKFQDCYVGECALTSYDDMPSTYTTCRDPSSGLVVCEFSQACVPLGNLNRIITLELISIRELVFYLATFGGQELSHVVRQGRSRLEASFDGRLFSLHGLDGWAIYSSEDGSELLSGKEQCTVHFSPHSHLCALLLGYGPHRELRLFDTATTELRFMNSVISDFFIDRIAFPFSANGFLVLYASGEIETDGFRYQMVPFSNASN